MMFRIFGNPITRRQDGYVTLYLSESHPTPPMPFELHGYICADDWAIRVPTLTKAAARYHKPIFERVWLFFALLISLILPLALHRLVRNAIYRPDGSRYSGAIVVGIIDVLIFLAALMLFSVPILIWKKIGSQRVRALIASYSALDLARSPIGFLPEWKMVIPGMFSTHTTLTISTPPTGRVTGFHPDAYLPAYISKVEEARAAYFYPYPTKAHEAGLPRMSVVGGGYGVHEKV